MSSCLWPRNLSETQWAISVPSGVDAFLYFADCVLDIVEGFRTMPAFVSRRRLRLSLAFSSAFKAFRFTMFVKIDNLIDHRVQLNVSYRLVEKKRPPKKRPLGSYRIGG